MFGGQYLGFQRSPEIKFKYKFEFEIWLNCVVAHKVRIPKFAHIIIIRSHSKRSMLTSSTEEQSASARLLIVPDKGLDAGFLLVDRGENFTLAAALRFPSHKLDPVRLYYVVQCALRAAQWLLSTYSNYRIPVSISKIQTSQSRTICNC